MFSFYPVNSLYLKYYPHQKTSRDIYKDAVAILSGITKNEELDFHLCMTSYMN